MKKLYSFLMLALTLALGAANAHAQSITVSSYEISAGVEGYDGTLYVSFGYDISEYRPDLQFYADGITPVEMGAYSWLSATFRNDNYDELRCGFGNNPGIARTAYLRVVLRDNAYPYAVIDSSDLITIYQEGADCPAPDHLALTEGSITQKGGSFTWTGYTNEYWMYIDLVEEADEGRLFTANFNEESLPSNENGYFINNSFSWGDTEGVITASNPNLGCIKSDNYLWDGTATLELYMFSKGYPTLISFEAMLLAGGNNKGSFWIDGIKVLELSGGDFQTKDWSHYTFELSAYYPHTLEWKFTKSDDPQYVDDAFFIDDILIYKYTEAYSYDPVHVYSNNVTLNDLGWGYTYRAYVQGVCPEVYDEQWGYWYSPQTGSSNYVFFTTAVECQKPDHLTATNMTGSSTDISWAGYGYDHFDIYCATEDLSNVNFRRVTGTCSSTITGLSPNTTYKVWLETTCEASMQKGNSTRGTMILISDTLLITTNCGAALPYFEDFENCAATTSDQVHYHSLPVCWESYNETFNDTWYDGYPTVMLTDSVSRYSYSGEQLLCLKSRYASSVTNTDQYAILPAMGTVPVNTLQLSFYACRGRDNYNNIPLYVGVMSDPEDIGTFELFKTIEITGVNTDVWGNDYDGYWYHGYNQYTVDFSNYTGQGKYIAFMMERATSSYEPKAIYIDDISCVSSVVPSSTCPTPTGLTASNVTTTSADLSWNSENGISSYNVEYREGASMNSTFFEEPFNNSGISWSWDQYSGLVDDVLAGTTELTYSSVWGTSSNALGAYSAKINIYGDERMGWLVTPETTLPTDAALTFDLALTSYNSSNAASTTGNDDRFVVLAYADGHWTKLREWNNSGSSYVFNDIATTGENVFIDLSAYGNKNVKIAFYGESTQYNGDNDLHIDNVTLGTASGAGEWQSAAENTHNTSAEITGLTPDTRYEVRVRCNCAGEDVSDWSELFTFNTPPSCPTVSQLEVLQVTNSTATITWREGGDESSWDIYVTTDINDVPNASTTPTEEYTDYNPYLVENLSPATTYYIYVRAVCDEYEKSEWSIPAVAMTKCEAMTLPYTYGFEDNQEFLYCWSYIKEGYHSIYTVNSNPHDGNSSLYLYRSSASNTLIAILPEVQANYNLKNYEISLYAKMVAPQETFAGTLHVGIMTDPNDASSFVQVGENITMTTDYAQYSVNLNSYTGNGHYIAIKVTSGSWGYLYIDDINVSQTTQGTHTVSVTSNSTEGGTVTGAGTYNDGETVTLSATPTPCYHFVNWTVNGVEVSTEAIYSFTVTDDAVYMANFELNQSTGIFDEQTACGSFTWIDGVTYTESGYYFYSHEDDNGCTKIDTLHLTIYNPTHTAITKTACGSYTWNGTAYTESGTYTYSHEDSHGCTQIDTLYLTINNATTGIDEQEACGSYTWIDGTTYNESTDEPTFTIENGSANGCDSIVTLHLTIHNPAHTATTETACGSYKWANGDGQTYDQSDTYTYSHEDANGCTQVDTLYLTINNPVNEVTTVVECGSYTWNGTAYTESGTYTYSHEDGNGCTQVDTLYLTINLPTTGIDEKEACGSYTWIDGTTYNESTDEPTFTIENGSANGCDSIVTLHLTIYNPVNEVSTASAVETYTWNNQTYTQSGTYTYNHEDDHGCTQVDTLYLTVYHASADEFAATACESYTWNNETYTASGDYTQTFTDIHGADSIVTLHLTINIPAHTATTETACGSYTWNGTTYTESGTYTYSHEDGNGCTQVDTLYLTINLPTTGIDEKEACDSYTWINNVTYNESTSEPTFTIENGNANGCDSIVTLHLTIYNPVNEATTISAVETYTWTNGNGETYTQSGTYTYNHEDDHGCTQVDTLYLTVYHASSDEFAATACESYTWNNETYSQSGDYTQTFTDIHGADSIVTLHLTINIPAHTAITETACGSYTWNGTTYTESGTYTYSHEDANGCTQVDTLYLTINNATTGIDEKEACGSYTWINNVTYNESTNEPTFTIENGNANGCDSIVTLHLTIYNPVNEATTISAVETYTWTNGDGQAHTESGDYTYSHEDDYGCTQVDTLHLTIYHASADEFAATACESYTWNNETYSQSGDYTQTFTDIHGADSIVTLHLTINIPAHTAITETACGSYTWDGTTYTESGTYTYSHEDANGCTQVDTLYLTINNATTGIDEKEACGSYTWINNVTYNESTNEPTFTIENGNANGCDSIVTLHLTIYNPVNEATTISAVETYAWTNGNGETYTQSGTYTYNHEDDHGCTQVDTLYLTVYHASADEFAATACESYTWNNETYSQSGDYTQTFTDIHGADSIVTLHLTINIPAHTATTETACGSYTWNGTTYTESGTYTYSHEDDNGCTQVDTLYLTINNATTGIDEKEACGSYTWINNVTYNESTNEPTFTIENGNANGCDSIVTLHLTIYNPVNEATTISAVETYTWTNGNGETYTQSGTYTYNHEDDHGCTQVDTLYLTIYHASADEFAATACESYTWNNETYSQSGDYTQTFTDIHGADSIVTLHLTIYNPVNEATPASAVYTYTWNDQTYTQSGTYTHTHEDAHGCTQVDTLYLTINYEITATVNPAEGGTVTGAGTYNYGETVTLNATANTGYTFTNWTKDGVVVSSDATYTFTVTESSDYVANFEIAISVRIIASDETICDGASVTLSAVIGDFNSPNLTYEWYTTNGSEETQIIGATEQTLVVNPSENTTYKVYVLQNFSERIAMASVTITVITMEPINLTVTPNDTICDGGRITLTADIAGQGIYSWFKNGLLIPNTNLNTITDSVFTLGGDITTYNYNLLYTSEIPGCQQTASTDITVFPSPTVTITGSSSIYNNSNVMLTANVNDVMTTATYTYQWMLDNEDIDTEVNSTLDKYYANNEDPYIFTVIVSNEVSGCTAVSEPFYVYVDDTASLQPTTYEFAATACESYTWNGETYTTSDDYVQTFTNIHGADSIVTLHLTINNPVHTAITETACGSYTWANGDGQTHTESGDYTYSHEDANGCTQIDTLHLTINNPVHTAITETACGSYTWTNGDGQTHTESGTYTYSHDDANGCTQVDTLHLTINNPVHTAITETACGSYTWTNGDGQTHTESGTYTYSHDDANGCTQVDTLHLTINHPVHTAITETACGSYTWTDGNGQTYTESGDYTYNHEDANGCTQVDTLHLTVNPTYNVTDAVTILSTELPYEWNGVTFTEAGTQVVTLQSANGCDSVVTMNLTVTTVEYYAITVNVSDDTPWGIVTGSGDFTYGSMDTLTATAFENYIFLGWSDNNNDNPRIITVTQDSTFTAYFIPEDHDEIEIPVNDSVMGSVNISIPGNASLQTMVTITAVPEPHYHFVSWSDNNTENPRMVTLMQALHLTAIFAIDQHTITVLSADENMGTVSIGGTYDYGTEISISADAREGYRFVAWNDGNAENPRTVTVEQDSTFVAYFEMVDGIHEIDGNSISIYSYNNQIVVVNAEGLSIEIFDMSGRLIVSESRITTSECNYTLYAPGIYLVRVGESLVKKVKIITQ